MSKPKQPVKLEILFDLADSKGGDGHFILSGGDPPKPIPFGTLIKWSQQQKACLEPTIQKDKNGVWNMPEVSRALSVFRGLLATTIHEGIVQIPDTKDWRGWVRVLEYWKQLVLRKLK